MTMTDDERKALAQEVVREVVREMVAKPLAASIGSALHAPQQADSKPLLEQIGLLRGALIRCKSRLFIIEREYGHSAEEARGIFEIALANEALEASNPVAQQAVPDGYKLVPVEPTWEMLEAALDVAVNPSPREVYAAMLAATPGAPAPQPLTEPTEYTGVRCMCVLTGCQAGPGCPHYTEHCRKHIDHERAHGITKGEA